MGVISLSYHTAIGIGMNHPTPATDHTNVPLRICRVKQDAVAGLRFGHRFPALQRGYQFAGMAAPSQHRITQPLLNLQQQANAVIFLWTAGAVTERLAEQVKPDR